MINLKKEEKSNQSFSFSEEDFSKFKWQNLKENERIFIPYSELPEGNVERYAFLDSLVAFIKQETGKHCSYILVNKTEPYEVNGFYIQLAPELLDRNGNYIKCDDIVYDRGGYEWHVIYYFQDNQLCILIDSGDEYQVVTSLSEYSLNPDDDFEEDDEEINADDYELTDSKCEKNEKINKVILTVGGILLLIGLVILFVFGY